MLTVERRFADLFAEWYAAQWDAYREALGEGWDDPPAPRFVELPFGDVPLREEVPHPHAQPFATFGTGPDQVRVQGQIDRIDVGRRGTTTTFAVIDYKTRSGERFDLKDSARAGAAACDLCLRHPAEPASGPRPGLVSNALLEPDAERLRAGAQGGRAKRMEPVDASVVLEIERSLHELLPRMATRIRAGEFPVHNDDRNCTGYCPYGTVCRVNQVRSIERERQKVWDLSLP